LWFFEWSLDVFKVGNDEKHHLQNTNCSVLNFKIFTINLIPGEVVIGTNVVGRVVTNGSSVVGSTQSI